ncbi:CPBP family intramembrane glutamic endopeptidase [Cohnella terricola]|uniref:CPBP family intramembrane metalloprotease n=1 Tax=Cohnella terricola TaxID=1289167 RepID=A0A559JJ12_9BACL|nr:CPBP family intramembrane glutamic endopeptidase [Cohnella terricola]TVX99861.1 CPBP family intramembrane metalloprotease [Cohnella terricola]
MKALVKIQTFLRSHPLLFAIFTLIASRIAGLGTTALVQLLQPELSIQEDLGWLLMVVYASVVVSLVYWTNTADEVGLRKPASLKEWLLITPLLTLPLLVLLENGIQSWGFAQNLVLVIAAIGVAINEEVLFRGILLRGFMKWGQWVAIFVPSAMFALAHLSNAFVGGDVTFAIYQTIWTFAAGVMLSAMRLRNNSLIPVIVLHIILDGIEYFSTGEYGVHTQEISPIWLQLFVLVNIVLAFYSLFLFYRRNKLLF